MDLYTKAIEWVLSVLGYRGNGEGLTPLRLIRGIRKACFGRRMNCRVARTEARKGGNLAAWKDIVVGTASGEMLMRALILRDQLSEDEAWDIQVDLDHAAALTVETLLCFEAAMAENAARVLDAAHAEALEYELELATKPS